MGIKNLNQFLKKHTDCIREIDISNLSNSILAVDTSIFLYKFKYSNKLLDYFIQQYYHFKKFNIELIYVFDGKPPKEKQLTLNNRKETRDKNNNKIEILKSTLENSNEVSKLQILKEIQDIKRKNITITREDILNVKYLFNILNIKYIQCDCEADLVCSVLYKRGIVNGCLSNDMDFLTFGTGILFRNYNLANNFFRYDLNEILQKLELTIEQFIDFCILCGCDYTNKIPRLGPETAYKLIRQYINIENIITNCCGENKKFKIKDEFDYIKARQQFTNDYKKDIIIINNEKCNKILQNDDFNYILNNTKYSEGVLKVKLDFILL